jgi:hypothetical protein
MEGNASSGNAFENRHKIPVAAFDFRNHFLITVYQGTDPVADSELDALVTKNDLEQIKHQNRNYFFIHVPDILGFDVVSRDCILEEVEVVVNYGAVQSTSATFLQSARPLE